MLRGVPTNGDFVLPASSHIITAHWPAISSIHLCFLDYKVNLDLKTNMTEVNNKYNCIWCRLAELWRRQWQPTPVLLPGKSHWQRSLVGCSPWGREISRTRLSDFTFTFHFHALEKEMAAHSSVLAWRIPAMGSHRVRHDWSDLAAAVAAAAELLGIKLPLLCLLPLFPYASF